MLRCAVVELYLSIQEAAKARQVAEMEEAALTAHGKYSSLQVGTSHLGSDSETYGSSLAAHNNHMRDFC